MLMVVMVFVLKVVMMVGLLLLYVVVVVVRDDTFLPVISSLAKVTDESLIHRADGVESERRSPRGGHKGEFLLDRLSDHRP